MSVEYDRYLSEHIANVNKGLRWMLDNMPEDEIDREALEEAISNSHDASKYDKDEYEAYDAYFYGGNRSYKVVKNFDYAWLNHIHKNPHHWQYWVLIEDDPVTGSVMKPLEMPMVYIYEMIADWWSFSWRDGNLFEIFKWYNEHHEKQYLDAKTLFIVCTLLARMWQILQDQEELQDHDISVIKKDYTPHFLKKEEAVEPVDILIKHSEPEEDEHKYGVPEQKKFPLPDADHVRSAIRFFNYVDPKYEKELAKAILERMDEYDMSFEDFGVGDENRFKKYIPKEELKKLNG